MAFSFKATDESALAASQSSRIETKGAYVGKFKVAKHVTSKKGTEGIEFEFESTDGLTAKYLTLWVKDSEGKEIFGSNQLSSLMKCLSVEDIQSIDAVVREWDHEQGAQVSVKREVYPVLLNVAVGIVLRVEEYNKYDGTIGEKVAFTGCFYNPETRQTAGEIIRSESAQELDSHLKTLKDKRLSPMNAAAILGAPPAAKNAAPFNDSVKDI